MRNIVRTAALELYATKNNEVVKVAGILDRLKDIFKRITDGNYADSIAELRGDSSMIQATSLQLKERIEDLQKAVKKGDVIGYDVALDSIRDLTSQLSLELSKINQDAQKSDPRPTQEATPASQAPVSQGPAQAPTVPDLEVPQQAAPISEPGVAPEVPVVPGDLAPPGEAPMAQNALGDIYTYEDQKADPTGLVARVTQSIKGRHPDFPVPIGKDVNIPVLDPSLNNWFGKNQVEISPAMRPRLIAAMAKTLTNKVPNGLVEEILSKDEGWNAFAKRLSNSIYNGTLLHYLPMPANRPPKDPDKNWVKTRQVGEMIAVIKTSDFKFPVLGANVSMIAHLNDVSPRPGGDDIMKLMQVSSVHSDPTVYPLIEATPEQPIQPEQPVVQEPPEPVQAVEPTEPEAAPPASIHIPEVKNLEPEPEAEKKKKTRKSRKKALRLEVLRGLIKNAVVERPYAVTQLNDVDFARVLAAGYQRAFGTAPSLETLGAAWAQGVLESGRPVHLPNNNIGNIKATKDWLDANKPFFVKDTKEVDKNRKEYTEHGTKWRSYDSPEEGAAGYWHLIGNKFKDAFQWMASGNAVNAAVSLGQKGYYTADIRKYSGAVGNLFNDFMSKIAPHLPEIKSNPQPPPSQALSSLPDSQPENDVQGLLSALVAMGPVEKIVRKGLLEQILPISNVLISLSNRTGNYEVRMKFAKTATRVFEEIIDAETSIHSDGNKIEIVCAAIGSQYSVASAVKALCDCISTGFMIHQDLEVRSIVIPATISKFAQIKE